MVYTMILMCTIFVYNIFVTWYTTLYMTSWYIPLYITTWYITCYITTWYITWYITWYKYRIWSVKACVHVQLYVAAAQLHMYVAHLQWHMPAWYITRYITWYIIWYITWYKYHTLTVYHILGPVLQMWYITVFFDIYHGISHRFSIYHGIWYIESGCSGPAPAHMSFALRKALSDRNLCLISSSFALTWHSILWYNS